MQVFVRIALSCLQFGHPLDQLANLLGLPCNDSRLLAQQGVLRGVVEPKKISKRSHP
jgi:hypothetical protein